MLRTESESSSPIDGAAEAQQDADVYHPESEHFDQLVVRARAGEDPEDLAAELWDLMTNGERLDLLTGDLDFWPGMRTLVDGEYRRRTYSMASVPRLGVPGLQFADGPRGCVIGVATSFPVPMARGATWDLELEERIGAAIGEEVRERGGNLFGGVCVNLPRHPAWGRAQETYSDQPLLLGAFGAASVRGVKRNVMACVKHFALNSMENARFSVDVRVDESTMHEDYLPHFRQAIEAGAESVMSSYNSVNGEWMGHNGALLTSVLRDDWGFGGFVVPDWVWGIRDGAASLQAGVDVEAPFRQVRDERLSSALDTGEISWAMVRRSGVRVLRSLVRYYAVRIVDEPAGSVCSPSHVALAREAASRAVVLLKNDPVGERPVLPLQESELGRVSVVGRLADAANTGDEGSSRVQAPYTVSVREGLSDLLTATDVIAAADDSVQAAVDSARTADAAVVVVGYDHEDEGEYVQGSVATRPEFLAQYSAPRDDAELADSRAVLAEMSRGKSITGRDAVGGDRADLHLRPTDVEMINAVAAANPRTVVVIIGASAILMEDWIQQVPAVVMGWYSGMEGGRGIADVLVGAVNPSGRMPYPIPASENDLPHFDMHADRIDYDRWWGHRLLQHTGRDALFPLGFGLSYTEYQLTEGDVSTIDSEAHEALGHARVRNLGDRDGLHVVQVYGARLEGERVGERELLGFAIATVPAGAEVDVDITLSLRPLGRWNPHSRQIVVDGGPVLIEFSSYWGDPASVTSEVRL